MEREGAILQAAVDTYGAALEKKTSAAEDAVRQYISENLLYIELLKKRGLNQETISMIRASYEDCVALAKRHRVRVSVLYDYIRFLWPLHAYDTAIETVQWLLHYYEQEDAPPEQQAALKNMLGILYAESHQCADGERMDGDGDV